MCVGGTLVGRRRLSDHRGNRYRLDRVPYVHALFFFGRLVFNETTPVLVLVVAVQVFRTRIRVAVGPGQEM